MAPLWILLTLLNLLPIPAGDEENALKEARVYFPVLLDLVLPSGSREGFILRDYIRSPEFANFRRQYGDRSTMDEIWYSALELTHGNRSQSFLAAAISTFEHEKIPIHLFGWQFNVRFTTESHSAFRARVRNLPKYVYIDSVNDVDKLQHFFMSGWLKESFGMSWLANLAGVLVEWGEGVFVAGSEADPRDLHANHDGVRFALHTEENLEGAPEDDLSPNPVTPTVTANAPVSR